MKPAQLRKLFARDSHCWHCGEDRAEYLVPHHRKGRGMGGRRSLDTLQNVILICAYWNGEQEANSKAQALAKHYGHKLEQWQDTGVPLYDVPANAWFVLDELGGKHYYQEE